MAANDPTMMAANDPTMAMLVSDFLLFLQELLKGKSWDPVYSSDWDEEEPTQSAVRCIKRDVFNRQPSAPPGCYIAPHEDNITKVHAIIVGPKDTPYEGGFFHFLIRFPPDYPSGPPRVKLLTTDDEKVRFNPNLYAKGMVCISMLGTWQGPGWTAAQTLYTVLEAIQGVMNKEPYRNEPDLNKLGMKKGHSKRYNEFLYHETLRVAVCGMIDKQNPNAEHKLPEELQVKIKELFLQNYDFYMGRVRDKIHLDKTGRRMMIDAYGKEGGKFSYQSIKPRLKAIKKQLS